MRALVVDRCLYTSRIGPVGRCAGSGDSRLRGARPSSLTPEPGGGPNLPDTSRTEARTARPDGSPEGGARSLPPSR